MPYRLETTHFVFLPLWLLVNTPKWAMGGAHYRLGECPANTSLLASLERPVGAMLNDMIPKRTQRDKDWAIVAVQWLIISHFVVLVWAELWTQSRGCGSAMAPRSPRWLSGGRGILFSQKKWFFIRASHRAGETNCSGVWRGWHLLLVLLTLAFVILTFLFLHVLWPFLLCFYRAQTSSWERWHSSVSKFQQTSVQVSRVFVIQLKVLKGLFTPVYRSLSVIMS